LPPAVFPFTERSLLDYVFSKQMLGLLLNILILPINTCVAAIPGDYIYGCSLTGATWSLIYEVITYGMVAALGFAGLAFQRGFLIAARQGRRPFVSFLEPSDRILLVSVGNSHAAILRPRLVAQSRSRIRLLS
jgi:hypothetical protein